MTQPQLLQNCQVLLLLILTICITFGFVRSLKCYSCPEANCTRKKTCSEEKQYAVDPNDTEKYIKLVPSCSTNYHNGTINGRSCDLVDVRAIGNCTEMEGDMVCYCNKDLCNEANKTSTASKVVNLNPWSCFIAPFTFVLLMMKLGGRINN